MTETLLIILGVLLCVCMFVIRNLTKKLESREDQTDDDTKYITSLEDLVIRSNENVTSAYNNMKQLDTRGVFESDDEVGTTFATLYDIITELNNVTNPESKNENK